MSSILMTQMVGRGVRGESSGGTREAYIVNFTDDWNDRILWVNLEKIVIENDIDFKDESTESRKHITRLISISKIEEFAILSDEMLDAAAKTAIENLEFIERIPLGIYYFPLLPYSVVENEKTEEKNCEVLVYSNLKQSYEDFISALPDLFSSEDSLTEAELNTLFEKVRDEFFIGTEQYPAYHPRDIKDILQFYAQNGELPKFIELKNREKFDIKKVADDIIEGNFGRTKEKEYIDKLWKINETEWKAFFGYENDRYFHTDIDLAIRRLQSPESYKRSPVIPTDEKVLHNLEQKTLHEIKEHNPRYWKWLTDTVYAQHRNDDGSYYSALGGYTSKNKLNFQIDHIRPMAKGGLTTIENLQLLTRKENGLKGGR